MDVKTTFFNESLDECIYMMHPYDFVAKSKEHMMCKFKKSIYGLKKMSRSWNTHFDQAIKSYSFDQCINEPCVYKKRSGNMVVFLVLYVNDILLIENNMGLLSLVNIQLSRQFDMKDLGEADTLGIKLL